MLEFKSDAIANAADDVCVCENVVVVHDASELNRWSKASREAWLRGERAPTTWEVVQAVLNRIVRYIELPTDGDDDACGHGATLSLWVLLMEHSARLLDTPAPASTLANRDAERWEPLLRIAVLTGQRELVGWMLDHAARQIETDTEDATPEADPSLLSALFQLTSTTPRVTPGDVLATAKEIDEEAFDDHWNARRVSHVLRRYGFRTARSNGKRIYRTTPTLVESIARRYGYEVDVTLVRALSHELGDRRCIFRLEAWHPAKASQRCDAEPLRDRFD